ncbi:hypothetical protein [Nonomuraea sp. NPDC050310]|uniref:hypothetical protein n=1 Tax=Nonomuraea sp. NPDC050310 TaxID=3154935 RepID=UPI0033F7E787
MAKSTRLSGHALRSEGKPFSWSSNDQQYVRTNALYGHETGEGYALCSCGEASPWCRSNAERKRWHAIHKRRIQERAASQEEES